MESPLRAASRIAAVTLGSRILGLFRDVLMFRMFGFGWAMGAFVLAWMIPNLLRRLFGEGALAASFIPGYTRAQQEHGPDQARGLLESVTGMLLLLLGVLTGAVLAVCWFLPPELLGSGTENVSATRQGEFLLQLTMVLFPYVIPICLAAILAGALNAHGIFALPAAAPIILNLFWIAALLILRSSEWSEDGAVRFIAVVLLAAGVAQMALSLVPLLRQGLYRRPRLPSRGDPALEVVRNMGPAVLGMSLLQINTVMDQAFANYFIDSSAPSFVYAANRLLLFPHALTTLAVATVIFPRLARLGAAGIHTELRRELDRALRHTMVIALPAAIGLMLVARPLLELLFEDSPIISQTDLHTASMTTICLVASLPSIGAALLHARAFYALGDYRTPAWMSLWMLVLNLLLNILLVIVFDLGVPGLALATTIAATVNATALRLILTTKCPSKDKPASLAPTVLACVVMAAAVYWVEQAIPASGTWELVLYDLTLPILTGVATYGGIQYLFGHRSIRMR